MSSRRFGRTVVAWTVGLVAAAALISSDARRPPSPVPVDHGRAALGLALRRLPVGARVLFVTAHPDDENNAVLALLARGRGVRTALLTLTRGEGGQNAIGGELFEDLGVLRTEELEAAHRQDGAEQYFTRAYDVGFSGSVEEALLSWDAEAVLGDVVRVVRLFRPDVLVTMAGEGGSHPHHAAAARLARAAFTAAGDPERFPGAGRPWRARRLYEERGGSASGPPAGLDTSAFDSLLGASFADVGRLARAMHRSQALPDLPARSGAYVLAAGTPGPADDLLRPEEMSIVAWHRFAGESPAAGPLGVELEALQRDAAAALTAFGAGQDLRPSLSAGLRGLRGLDGRLAAVAAGNAGVEELRERLGEKESQFEEALARAAGAAARAWSDRADATAGGTVTGWIEIERAGTTPVDLSHVDLTGPGGAVLATVSSPAALARQTLRVPFAVRLPETLETAGGRRRAPGRTGHYEADDPLDLLRPAAPPVLCAQLVLRIEGVAVRLQRPVLAAPSPSAPPLALVAPVSVVVEPDRLLVPRTEAAAERAIRVRVHNEETAATAGVVRLEMPEGWLAQPSERAVRLAAGASVEALFRVRSAGPAPEGSAEIHAVARASGRDFREGRRFIGYPHVAGQAVRRQATVRLDVVDVRAVTRGPVGYVGAAGDPAADALRQMGLTVRVLEAPDLASDLSPFTSIVTGPRAYDHRADLRTAQDRLLGYVRGGGHLVVQHNGLAFNAATGRARLVRFLLRRPVVSPYAPYPARVTSARVADERAPVHVVDPESPLLRVPNAIGERDWEGWVQDRGLNLLEAEDGAYRDVIACGPGEHPARGALVEARVGKGTWTYVGLTLFRQLAAGTPGAYRLLANLVSRPPGGP